MAYTFNGSNQRITIASTPITVAPLTIACWYNTTDNANTQGFVNVCNSTGNQGFRLQIRGNIAGDPVSAQTIGSSNGLAYTTAAYSINTWQHACGVFTSTTSRTAYLNGGNAGTNTTACTVTGADRIIIGMNLSSSAATNLMNGQLAEIGIWNIALATDDIIALADGVSPSLVRSNSLVFYAPLLRELIDLRDPRIFTNVNAATVSAHPRIYL